MFILLCASISIAMLGRSTCPTAANSLPQDPSPKKDHDAAAAARR